MKTVTKRAAIEQSSATKTLGLSLMCDRVLDRFDLMLAITVKPELFKYPFFFSIHLNTSDQMKCIIECNAICETIYQKFGWLNSIDNFRYRHMGIIDFSGFKSVVFSTNIPFLKTTSIRDECFVPPTSNRATTHRHQLSVYPHQDVCFMFIEPLSNNICC